MKSLAHSRLLELLHYDPTTGLFSWKVQNSNRIKIGSLCLNKDRHGYIRIRLDNQLYWAARLAWFYTHGVWPQHDIDHINGIRDDNRISNLREATRSQNLANRKPKHNGPKGVTFVKRTGKWVASVAKNRVVVFHKYFETKEEAKRAYLEAAKLYHGEFARGS